MSDFLDLRAALASWPYDPDADARRGRGDDGREILQVRTLMGIEQYEVDGRPDGARPHGRESALEYHVEKLQRPGLRAGKRSSSWTPVKARSSSTKPRFTISAMSACSSSRTGNAPFAIPPATCAPSTSHRYAQREEDRLYLEKWRPYILRINATARAMLELESGHYEQALHAVRGAMETINALEELDDETFKFERQRSLSALRELARQIERSRPLSETQRLEKQLRRAIERQEFERAAELRDRLRALRKQEGG
jgi:hypothetical protein